MNQEKIGKYIVECRKKKNMTQQELAEKLGVSDRTIGNWENGRNMPDLSLFKPLSEILGISIAELLDGGKIDKNNIAYKSEEILTNTINYQTEKIRKKENKYIFFICFLSLIIIIALNVNTIFNNDSLEYLPLIVLGVIFIFLGIMNYKGNISSIHWYNRRNVSKKDVKNYGKLMGIGTIILGVGMIVTAIFQLFFDLDESNYILIFSLISGIITMIYAQFKYNKGIF